MVYNKRILSKSINIRVTNMIYDQYNKYNKPTIKINNS